MADIEARGLVKRYGSLSAVDGVSFSVERGEVFGMLGPNGAGKTTTLEMLEGLRDPDHGTAEVLGADITKNAHVIKERIGVQLQATALPAYTKVREAIELFASFYANSRSVGELLEEFNLVEKQDAYSDKLSGGQLQRLSIALALVNDPDLVFLDEPTTGLDPQARLNIWAVVEGVKQRGKTVMLTTHYMEEAERLCDRIAVMDGGKIVALDTPSRLIAEYAPGTTIEFEAPSGVNMAALEAMPGVEKVSGEERVSIGTTSPEVVLRGLLDPAATWAPRVDAPAESGAAAHGVHDLLVRQGTLEDVFIALTGRTLRT